MQSEDRRRISDALRVVLSFNDCSTTLLRSFRFSLRWTLDTSLGQEEHTVSSKPIAQCTRCKSEFSPDSVEAWRAAFLAGSGGPLDEEWGPVCPMCADAPGDSKPR